MIQARITFRSNGKPSAEIKIEIAFIIIKFEIHITYVRLLYEILREKSLVTLENRIFLNINLTLTNVKRYARVVLGSVNANATNTLSRMK